VLVLTFAGILDGPNIYERCLFALRSGIRSEQAFGLNHLVKISYERGDKYKFSQFSGLAEGLTEFALGVGSLFYHVDWTICNDPEVDEFEEGELDGINGSSDILDRIARLKPKPVQDNFQPAEFTDHMTLVTEAVLTIRNMVMLPENAWFMSEYMPLKDLLCILLHLPDMDIAVELKHSALDIAEQITPYLVLNADDPLYKTLLAQLGSTDRGTILTALRAISRIAMNHPTETNKLSGVPQSVLLNLMDWLLLNDDELMDACLDFLYQYTAIVSNLDALLQATNMEHLVSQLVRLLSHGAKRGTREYVVSDASLRYDNEDSKASDEVHAIPKDLLERLLAMEEPERCYQWLKCFFEEDPESNVTQIAVWQAYNNAFLEPLKKKGRGMINAAEFIRNISTVYQAAGAQIVREVTPQGEQQRFIIRGIRARQHPMSPEGRSYFQCLWKSPGAAKCSVWNLTAAKTWEHILQDHLDERPNEEDKLFKNREGEFSCHWGSCRKYPEPTKLNLFQFMAHIKTHVTTEEAAYANSQSQASAVEAHTPSSRNRRPKPRVVEPAKTIQLPYEETASVRDERNQNAPPQAAGIPLSAMLILRNIARNIGKTEAEEALTKQEREAREMTDADGDLAVSSANSSYAVVGYKERLFRPVMGRLWEVFTENRLLAKDMSQLLQLLGT
jgi:chromatin structure-remodeling complex subunit RSC9